MTGPAINPRVHLTFTPVPDWLAAREELSATAKLIYARLARYYDEAAGHAYPKMAALAAEVGAGERQVRSAIRELEEVGLIAARRRGLGMSNVYTFHAHPWRDDTRRIRAADSADQELHMPADQELHTPADQEMHMPAGPSLKREQGRDNYEETTVTLAHARGPRRRRIDERRIDDLWHEVMGAAVSRRPLTSLQVRDAVDLETLAIERGLDPALMREAMEETARRGIEHNPWLYFLRVYRNKVDGDPAAAIVGQRYVAVSHGGREDGRDERERHVG